jgi:hypothetical protein
MKQFYVFMGKSWWRHLLYKFIVLTDSSNIVIKRMNTMAGYDSHSLCCKKNDGKNTPLYRYLTLVQISSQDVYNYPNQKYV